MQQNGAWMQRAAIGAGAAARPSSVLRNGWRLPNLPPAPRALRSLPRRTCCGQVGGRLTPFPVEPRRLRRPHSRASHRAAALARLSPAGFDRRRDLRPRTRPQPAFGSRCGLFRSACGRLSTSSFSPSSRPLWPSWLSSPCPAPASRGLFISLREARLSVRLESKVNARARRRRPALRPCASF